MKSASEPFVNSLMARSCAIYVGAVDDLNGMGFAVPRSDPVCTYVGAGA